MPLPIVGGSVAFRLDADWLRVQSDLPVRVYLDDVLVNADVLENTQTGRVGFPTTINTASIHFAREGHFRDVRLETDVAYYAPPNVHANDGICHLYYGRGPVADVREGSAAHYLIGGDGVAPLAQHLIPLSFWAPQAQLATEVLVDSIEVFDTGTVVIQSVGILRVGIAGPIPNTVTQYYGFRYIPTNSARASVTFPPLRIPNLAAQKIAAGDPFPTQLVINKDVAGAGTLSWRINWRAI